MAISAWICIALWLGLNVAVVCRRVYVTRPSSKVSRGHLEANAKYAALR